MDQSAYAAGLQHGYVKLSDGTILDIGAVVSAEGEKEVDEVEIKGDDELLKTFVFAQRESLTIVANGISFDVLAAITGNTPASSPTGEEIALGTDSEKNAPYVEIGAKSIAEDEAGTSCFLEKIWHKVQIKTTKLSQAGESEFNIEMAGIAYSTDEDIEGGALSPKRVATVKLHS